MELVQIENDFPKELPREELEQIKWRQTQIEMCRQMLRKDFELLKIQNCFYQVFNEVDFFSKPNDDVASIEHVIQIAHGKVKEEFIGPYFDYLLECGLQLAFSCYSSSGSDSNSLIEEKSRKLTNLIFQSSTFEDSYTGLKYFLEEFMKSYPEIEIPQAKSFMRDANKSNWWYL